MIYALLTIVILSLIAANVLVNSTTRYNVSSRQVKAWKEAGHTVFFLKPGWTDLTFWEQANKFTKCFPEIIEQAMESERGATFSVTVNGKIALLK